jgi:phosphoribosylanthranilate isomerase
MTPRVKICGITRPEDGVAAAHAGADAVGLVFWPHSPRAVTTARARSIVAALPPFVTVVGLFVDPAPEEVRATLAAVPIDVLQFHGAETAALCRSFGRPYLKAVAASPETDLLESLSPFDDAAGVLIDAPIYQGMPGGTGRTFDWSLLPERLPRPLVLSGGLHAGNVREAIRHARPWAVDVSSGVEAQDATGAPIKGIKDAARIAAFIEEVRHAAR